MGGTRDKPPRDRALCPSFPLISEAMRSHKCPFHPTGHFCRTGPAPGRRVTSSSCCAPWAVSALHTYCLPRDTKSQVEAQAIYPARDWRSVGRRTHAARKRGTDARGS